jgi:hypothetical protein
MKHLTLSPYRAGMKVWISIPRTEDIEHRAIAGMLFAERSQYYCWGEEQPGHRIGLEAVIQASKLSGFFKDLQDLHKLRDGVMVYFQATDCP